MEAFWKALARMFATVYKKKGLHSKNLSRSLEDGGTLTSVFIPWNTCGVFIYTTLEVHAFSYAPYAMLNFTVPIVALIYAYKVTISYISHKYIRQRFL